MKILLLCWRDTDHPQGGGSERYLERVAEYLARQGHDVWYRTAGYPGASPREVRSFPGGGRITFSRGGNDRTVYPRALGAILATALRLPLGRLRGMGRPDVVVDTQNGIPFGSVLLTPVLRCPVIVLTHHCHREQWPVAGPLLSRVGWLIESRIAPFMYRHCQYVTVSRPSAQELAELGVDPDRITIVRNGVDKAPASSLPHAADTVYKLGGEAEGEAEVETGVESEVEADEIEIQIPAECSPHLVTVSRLVPHKQIEHAIDTVAALRGDFPGVHLSVIGDGWWAANLRNYAKTLGVSDRITFWGHVDEYLKHRILAQSDIHLLPSRKEGWGIAVIEAAEHHVPTVGYYSSAGLRDSIQDAVTGRLVQGKDDFIATVRQIASDDATYHRLADGAFEFSQQFSWDTTGRQFADVLAEVADGCQTSDDCQSTDD